MFLFFLASFPWLLLWFLEGRQYFYSSLIMMLLKCNLFILLFVYVCVCVCIGLPWHMCRSEKSLVNLVLYFYLYTGPRDWTQVVKLHCKCFYRPNHVTGLLPWKCILTQYCTLQAPSAKHLSLWGKTLKHSSVFVEVIPIYNVGQRKPGHHRKIKTSLSNDGKLPIYVQPSKFLMSWYIKK